MASIRFCLKDQVVVREITELGIKKYQFFSPVQSIPQELCKWLGVNPRRAQRTPVHAGIVNTITNEPDRMILRNAGLMISADSVVKKGNQVIVTLKRRDLHGLIDGNNTRAAIERAVSLADGDLSKAFVDISIMTGMRRTDVVDVASGQNIRKPVQRQSLLDFTGYFDEIKTALGNRDDISYCEGDEGAIPIGFLIQILTSVNTMRFPDETKCPFAYAHVGTCLKIWEESNPDINPDAETGLWSDGSILAESSLEILEAYEYLMTRLPALWNSNKGKWGYVETKAARAIGLVMLQALRPVVEMDPKAGTFAFTKDLDEVLDGCGKGVVAKIKNAWNQGGTKKADSVGKNSSLYDLTYSNVAMWLSKQK